MCVRMSALCVCVKVEAKLGVFCGAKVRVKLGVLRLLSAAGASFRAKRAVAQLL